MIKPIIDMVGVTQVEDFVGETYGHPHFRDHRLGDRVIPGCNLSFIIRPDGLVYCDCGSQIGRVSEAWSGVLRPMWLRRTRYGFEVGTHRDLFPEKYSTAKEVTL
jgi:hypothetical protein